MIIGSVLELICDKVIVLVYQNNLSFDALFTIFKFKSFGWIFFCFSKTAIQSIIIHNFTTFGLVLLRITASYHNKGSWQRQDDGEDGEDISVATEWRGFTFPLEACASYWKPREKETRLKRGASGRNSPHWKCISTKSRVARSLCETDKNICFLLVVTD